MLGALLAAILGVAVGISLRIYTQLDRAQREQSRLVEAERNLDQLVNEQLIEETSLRGFLATGLPLFLRDYYTNHDSYAGTLRTFEATSGDLGIAGDSATREMRSLHDAWEREAANPLIAQPHAKDRLTRETLGKVDTDQLRGETEDIDKEIQARLTGAQAQLKRRIDEALFGGLASVFVFGLVCIVFVTTRHQMQVLIDREREIVETLQGAFSTDVDVLPGARIGRAYISADVDAAVGGDLYDVRRLDSARGLVVMADVSGKGIQAAVNTAFVKYSIRMLARTNDDPAHIVDEFNRAFVDTVRDPNLFVVVFVGLLDMQARTLTYASAGHGGAYLRRGGDVRQLGVTGPIVGMDGASEYDARTEQLERGDLVLLATDGLYEARDPTGAMLDDVGAMELLRNATVDPQRCADDLVAAVRERSGGSLHDDLALLVIAIDGLETADPARPKEVAR